VYWSDSGDLVAIATDETFYVLRYNRAAHFASINAGKADPNEGVEDAFELVAELSEKYSFAFGSPNL
jgi:coatomer subunit beta'